MCTGCDLIAGSRAHGYSVQKPLFPGSALYTCTIDHPRDVSARRVRSCGVRWRRGSKRGPECRGPMSSSLPLACVTNWSSPVVSQGDKPVCVRVRGHVTVRVSLCLSAVLSLTCVDSWAGPSSGDSFKTVAPVTSWGWVEPVWITGTHLTMRTLRVDRS
jgi:hypothetical protein